MTREEEMLSEAMKHYDDIAFLDGVKWADEHLNLESLWHDVIEPPKLGEWFLAQIGNIAFDTFIMAMNKNEDWREWSKDINIKRWAYISDLLPRGGEQ